MFDRLFGRPKAIPVEADKPILESTGHCPTCDQNVRFESREVWLRDFFFCTSCGSIPRERALMRVIESFYPAWRELTVHESSPGGRGASARLAEYCPGYLPSQYFPDVAPGEMKDGMRCENFEALSFADASIDLHVSQDVIEHVFDPARAFSEIARTLRPGGAHVFTVPIVNREKPSSRRARLNPDGSIEHLQPPSYHGNPISDEGVLVTMDWGFDICQHIFDACGLFTYVIQIDDLSQGIRAEFIEVLVTVKPAADVCELVP